MHDSSTLQQHLSDEAVKNIMNWLEQPKYLQYKSELSSMIEQQQWKELEDAFFKVIEFGTGGRRGTTGIGSNRINRVTIGESAQALCEYVLSLDQDASDKGVVIACDTRLSSPELSQYAASVCAAMGFKTYIFENFRSTPELSFAVRELGCAVGIVISASHNPPADNGFKAYWADGGQLVAPHDKGVLALAEQVAEIKETPFDAAVADGRIVVIGDQIDEAYISAAASEAECNDRDIAIVYSPLHGTGQTNVLPVLRRAGFENISEVTAQMVPDGNFPTIANGKPNPEEKSANDQAVAQMLAEGADIAITNDPDADRIGVVIRVGIDPYYLSGNQSAALATDFVLRKKQAKGELTNRHYIAKTIVTTDLMTSIGKSFDVGVYDNLLVGFKYIGELILRTESTGETFVIGGEESYGLLKGEYARDKDGASGALLLAEYAAELKRDGKNLHDRLLELYAEHGVYVERLDSVVSPGADGFDRMNAAMASLRSTPPKSVGDQTVTALLDYSSLTRTDIVSGQTTPIDAIAGNVVVLEFGDTRRRITVRPSGTEPKIKFYVQWYESAESNEATIIDAQYTKISSSLTELSKELESVLFTSAT